jgi:hypothetical protein
MYLAAAVFYVIDTYYCLNEPLHVWSRWAGNATASAEQHGNELRKHYERLLEGRPLEFVPLKFAMPNNCIANAILAARHDFEGHNGSADVDWCRYFASNYEFLMYLKAIGTNVRDEVTEFVEVLAREEPELQEKVKIELRRHPPFESSASRAQRLLKAFVKKTMPFAVDPIRNAVRGNKDLPHPRVVNGSNAGFSTILESAKYMDDRVLSGATQLPD